MKASSWLLAVAGLGATALAGAGQSVFHPTVQTASPTIARSMFPLEPSSIATGSIAAVPMDWEAQSEGYEARLIALRTESETLQTLTVARGRSYVRRARAGLLPASEGFDAFAQHLAQLERLRRAISRDFKRQDAIVKERLATANSLKRLQALRPAAREAMTRARNAVLASKERDAAFAKAFQSSSHGSTERRDTVYGALSISKQSSHTDFERRLGKLPFPIGGRTEMTSVRSPSGSGRALSIQCAAGAAVRAVHQGRIAFADNYPEQGKTVIVDHGDNHFSVSANLQAIDVHVGDELSAGERIGRAGFHDGKSRLLFEIRRGNQTLNTPLWFGL